MYILNIYIYEHLKTLPVFTRLYLLEWILESKYCHKCSWKQITLKPHIVGNTVSVVYSCYSGVLREEELERSEPLGMGGTF